MTQTVDSPMPPFQRVAVIGAGTMGEGIAQSCAEAGLMVRLIDLEQTSLVRCRQQIAANLAQARSIGLDCDVEATLQRIEFIPTDGMAEASRDCEVVIETVPEILALKQKLFSDLDSLPKSVLLASNTSSMTMTAICGQMRGAARAIGLHYFNPAHIIPTVEVHRGANTADDAVARAVAFLRRTGKSPLVVKKEIPGFVINRLTGALSREIAHLLDEGIVDPAELDAAVKGSIGFRLAWVGPMEGADFIGLDTDARVSAAVFGQLSNRNQPSLALEEKVRAGKLGVKTGSGWYDYGDKSRAELLFERNEKLLSQLKAFREAQEK
ncbi:MAG: 3-hydroxyacyl-CoA dehydrogenase family protein [Burkholderiales bacterium]